jgi:hypothetical protein
LVIECTEMKSCPRCGKQNDAESEYCGKCGLNLHEYQRAQSRASTQDEVYCYKHPKEQTNLSCGRCERPICTKCAIIGPAGPRCKECAKHKVEFRAGAVALNARRTITSIGKVGPWGIYILVIAAVTLVGALRSCGNSGRAPVEPAQPTAEQDETRV